MIQQSASTPLRRRAPSLTALLPVIALGLVTLLGRPTSAAELYATSIAGSQIDKVDTVANTVTTFLNTPSAADSIMFDSMQRVIYTQTLLRRSAAFRFDQFDRRADRQRLQRTPPTS